jgi:hypothetical protein
VEIRRRSFAWVPTADRLALCKTPTCYTGDGWAALNFWPDDEVNTILVLNTLPNDDAQQFLKRKFSLVMIAASVFWRAR